MIEKTTLKAQAHEHIKDAIASGKIELERVYSVFELSAMLNISRTPLREAILQLEQEGVVNILPNKGMRIRRFDKGTIKDVYQMRMAVEGYCCSYLAQHIAEEEAQKILLFITMLTKGNRENNGDLASNNLLFHQKIVSFSGNRRFEEIISNVSLYTNLFTAKLLRWSDANAEHDAILSAIAAGDADGARQASDVHVLNTYHAILNSGRFDLE